MKYLSKIIEYGLYLSVFLLPLQARWIIRQGLLNNGPWEYGSISLYATDILLIFILLLFIIYGFLQRRTVHLIQNTKHKTQNYFIFGLILVSAISIFFAPSSLLALYRLGWLMLGAGLFWLLVKSKHDRIKLIWSFLGGVAVQSMLAIWQFLSQTSFANKWFGLASHQAGELGTSVIETIGRDGMGERWLRAYGGMDHPNILGGLVAIGLLLLVGEIIRIDGLIKKPLVLNSSDGEQVSNKFGIKKYAR